MLKSIADGLFLHMRAIRARTMAEADRVNLSVDDHMHIIEALENRDGDLASKLVREHTMQLHAHIRQSWHEFTDPPMDVDGNAIIDTVGSKQKSTG